MSLQINQDDHFLGRARLVVDHRTTPVGHGFWRRLWRRIVEIMNYKVF